ncbi:hypothetical protein [Peterkaempfera bronchialis]|uniref:Transposase DDE domain-containing protein n=1 Tax=Peterkaempfera bronchialis TaxID=2126346 RepID=A0A345SS77_9ACTN|nr:hypothetical protein [Peterkaempfera bronchialis]AXI76582.1 hypothetical protein C7M71_002940 [Peterkaempfera bronchialis]
MSDSETQAAGPPYDAPRPQRRRRLLLVSLLRSAGLLLALYYAQDPHPPAGRLQGPPGHRARDRLIDRCCPATRKLRHRGTTANDTWLHTRAAALNLRRLINLGLTRTHGTWQLAPATG